MRWLAEHDIGFATTVRKVPIVPAAVLFDLGLGKAEAFPGEAEGYLAAKRARGGAVEQGSIGAGTGATVAKILGKEHCLKGGLGSASVAGPRGLVVGAIVANNASGQVVDPDSAKVMAGPRARRGFVSLPEAMQLRTAQMDALVENTTLVCVATNAALDHHQAQRLAIQAHDGIARAIIPAHTFGDGDVAFAVAMGQVSIKPDDMFALGLMTVRAVERALVKSVELATGLHGVPSAGEWLAAPAAKSRRFGRENTEMA
jgi:L-aminopeptidase/D-esterase-like protein